ncbi:branched-chain amino acid ABC transporter permease (plasmid) [Paraburkholderia sp. PREW-6R]|uniref:branched-chain amino acid ABC transporter permease n=1 Tax=Paraburkholderia sp. PREW-6R TaxID=3141544 RepID=UPI0031F5B483
MTSVDKALPREALPPATRETPGRAVPTYRQPRALIAVWIVLALVPFVSPNSYVTGLVVTLLLNVMLLAGLNLVSGYTGQISLCHAGFYGLGAYASGVLSVRLGTPPLVDLLAAVGVGVLVALVVGMPTFRLRGHYLAMATLGLNAIVSVLFVELVDLTGGPNGLSGIEPMSIAGFAFDTDRSFYWLCCAITFAAMWAIYNLIHSRIGRAMVSLGNSETGAQASGVDTQRTKLVAFALSAGLAAAVGSLYGHYAGFISPESFSVSVSILLMVMVAVGGKGRFFGPLFGALVYTVVPEALRAIPDAELLIFGVAMVVVLTAFPAGIAGAGERVARRVFRVAGRDPKQGRTHGE